MPLMRRRYIFEADDDNQTGTNGGQNQVQSTANNASTDANNNDNANDNSNNNNQDAQSNTDDNSQDNTNDNNDQENNDENNDQNNDDNSEEDDDYSVDADPDEDEDNGDDDNSNDDDSSSDDDNNDSDDDSADQDTEEKQMDRDMFSTLSEDEQKRKIATLKRLFIDMYSKTDGLIEKFGSIDDEDDENFMPIIKRILTILYDVKEYLSYYILNVFDKNSYIENDITFNRYLSVLNGIKLIMEDLEKEKDKEDTKK